MLQQKDLKREIYSKKDSLSMKDLFLSDEYGEFLTQMADGITECSCKITSKLFYKDNDMIAYTDGQEVNINYESVLSEHLNKLQRHLLYCGLNLHECGHVLFTDFRLHDKVLQEMKQGNMYPTPIKNKYTETVHTFLQCPGNYAYIVELFNDLDNSIEDGFVDRAVMAEVPGYARCLKFVNQIDKSLNSTYEDMILSGMDDPSILLNLTLAYARHGSILFSDDLHDEITDMFREMIPYIEDAVFETHPLQRKKAVWAVFGYIFHFFDAHVPKNEDQTPTGSNSAPQNGQGDPQQQPCAGQDSGNAQQHSVDPDSDPQNGQGSPQQQSGTGQDSGNAQQQSTDPDSAEGKTGNDVRLKEMLEQAGRNAIHTEKTQHISPTVPSNQVINELSHKMKRDQSLPLFDSTQEKDSAIHCEDELERIAEKVAMSQICNRQEREIQSQMKCDVKVFLDNTGYHKNVAGIVKRASISSSAKEKYDTFHAELDMIVKRLLSEFQKEIKDRQLGDTLTGLYAGKRFNARESYRYDKRVMSRKIAPEDIPDMVVGVLIDISGSMILDKRLETAIRCAYITYQFCHKLGIPCFIIGHTTFLKDVVLVNVCDEKSLDQKDPLRIFSLSSGNDNRDGYAVWFCIKKLEKIIADQKLLMVISDGLPNHNGYGLIAGRADCQAAVKYGIKKGITTIAAAIENSEGVRSVYKSGVSEKNSAEFLDITDLQKLPKAFVKIIKKRLL